MQHITKILIAAAMALVVLTFSALSTMAQTTGPGDHVLVNMALDRNYNCIRGDSDTCLPDTAPQRPDIPLMPSAGGGGASNAGETVSRPPLAAALTTSDVSAGYIDSDDNWIFIAISAVCLVGILFLIHQFIRLIRQKNSP